TDSRWSIRARRSSAPSRANSRSDLPRGGTGMTTGGDRFAAIDLGATSGRVIVGEVDGERITAAECSRFDNRPVRAGGLLQWDALSLWADAVDGVARAARENPGIRSVAVDTWGVDYGLT